MLLRLGKMVKKQSNKGNLIEDDFCSKFKPKTMDFKCENTQRNARIFCPTWQGGSLQQTFWGCLARHWDLCNRKSLQTLISAKFSSGALATIRLDVFLTQARFYQDVLHYIILSQRSIWIDFLVFQHYGTPKWTKLLSFYLFTTSVTRDLFVNSHFW